MEKQKRFSTLFIVAHPPLWAYGPGGDKLRDKHFLLSISAGFAAQLATFHETGVLK